MQLEQQVTVNEIDSQLILKSISNILSEIINETDNFVINPPNSVFYTTKKPSISLLNYLIRIDKYTQCSNSCYILALIYIDRMTECHPEIIITSFCVHRLLITAIVVAIKYNDDDYYKNEFYAKVGGITLKEINALENEFLSLINFAFYVDDQTFQLYQQRLKQYSDI